MRRAWTKSTLTSLPAHYVGVGIEDVNAAARAACLEAVARVVNMRFDEAMTAAKKVTCRLDQAALELNDVNVNHHRASLLFKKALLQGHERWRWRTNQVLSLHALFTSPRRASWSRRRRTR